MKETEERLSSQERKIRIRERYKGIDEELLDVIPAIKQDGFYDEDKIKRVGVYARVSTDDPRQTSSYELQKNYYNDLVSRRPDWDLVDIYADEGISGTSLAHRDEFKRMIADCEAGKLDLIVTKSISRFARNLMDCVGYIRKLRALAPPVGVFFETEHLYTLDANSEMTLSLMATLAQEESHTKSEIMNASIEMRFKRGIFLTPVLLGYDQDIEGNLVINEEEAKTVRLIFFLYLYGYTAKEIADTMTELGRTTKRGKITWSPGSILEILQNERHCGDVLARKTFTPDYLTHKSKKNRHDRNQYRMKDHHESIVSRDDFIAVQRLISNAKYGNKSILPALHVVSDGLLSGFVSINPRWAGFKVDDYYEACYSADYENDSLEIFHEEHAANEGDFDLRGYEIAHGQFFEANDRCCVTIAYKGITFSQAAIRRFRDTMTVELLIHPVKKLLAVRAVNTDVVNAVAWAKKSNGKTVPKKISGTACLPTIFELLNWQKECRYRLLGSLYQKDENSILLFDMKEIEVLIPQHVIDRSGAQDKDSPDMVPFKDGSSKQILAYPNEWSDRFGNSFYSHEYDTRKGKTDFEKMPEVPDSMPYKESDIKVTDPATLKDEIETMIAAMKEDAAYDRS